MAVVGMRQTQEGREVPRWSRRRFSNLGLAAVLGILFVFCFMLARPLLGALAWALTLAVIAWPLHRWVMLRIGNPSVAAAISTILVAVMLGIPTWFVIHRMALEIVENLLYLNAGGNAAAWNDLQDRNPLLHSLVVWVGQHIDLHDEGRRAIAYLVGSVPSLIIHSLWTVLEILTTFFALFYFFRDQRPALAMVRALMPLTKTEMESVFARIRDTLHATIYGTLFCAALQGTLGGLMFWWLGLPAPTVWGITMGLLAIVPYLGAFVIWIPAVVWLALEGNWGHSVLLTIWGGIVIALIDNFIYPVLVGKRMGLHSLAVFVAVIGGLTLLGASGVILGPLILAVTDALVVIWRQRMNHGSNPRGAAASNPESVTS